MSLQRQASLTSRTNESARCGRNQASESELARFAETKNLNPGVCAEPTLYTRKNQVSELKAW